MGISFPSKNWNIFTVSFLEWDFGGGKIHHHSLSCFCVNQWFLAISLISNVIGHCVSCRYLLTKQEQRYELKVYLSCKFIADKDASWLASLWWDFQGESHKNISSWYFCISNCLLESLPCWSSFSRKMTLRENLAIFPFLFQPPTLPCLLFKRGKGKGDIQVL